MRKFGIVLSVVMTVFSVVLAGCGTLSAPASTSKTVIDDHYQTNQWEQLLDGLAKRPITLHAALAAFSYAITPLPGVSITKHDHIIIPSGTFALDALLAHWDELTLAQQQTVNVYVQANFGGVGSPSALLSDTEQQHLSLANPHISRSLVAPLPAIKVPANSPDAQPYLDLMNQDIAILNGKLNYEFPLQIRVRTDDLNQYDFTNLGEAMAVDTQGGYTSAAAPAYCIIHLNIIGMTSIGWVTDDLRAVIAHELFHCYQSAMSSSLGAVFVSAFPAWITEGSAAWVGTTLNPGAMKAGNAWWTPYLDRRDLSLFDRKYDAIGFFSQLDHIKNNVWAALKRAYTPSTRSLANEAYFTIIVGPSSTEFLRSWATSYQRESLLGPDWGPDWEMVGPTIPMRVPAGIPTKTFGNGTLIDPGAVPPYQIAIFSLITTADVVQFQIPGFARIHDRGKFETSNLTNASFCTKSGGCQCPNGPPSTLTNIEPDIDLAVASGDTQTPIKFQGVELANFCKKPQTPVPPQGSTPPGTTATQSSQGTAYAMGDVHLHTFNDAYADFQAVGEFRAVKSTTDSFEVQLRLSPAEGIRTISLMTGAALQVGADRLSFQLQNNALQIGLNGQATVFPVGKTLLPSGGSVDRGDASSDKDYFITLADGSTVILFDDTSYLDMTIILAPQRFAHVVGLLGTADGTAAKQILTSQGNGIAPPYTYDQLYHLFGDSWRVTSATSLFTYASGQSTETFTDRTFPAVQDTIDSFSATIRQQAQAICASNGIVDPALLAACILDIAETGDANFAVSTSQVQKTFTHIPFGTAVTGTLTTATQSQVYTFVAKAGDIVYLQSQEAPSLCQTDPLPTPTWEVAGPDGVVIPSKAFIFYDILTCADLGRYLLTMPGTYSITISHGPGSYAIAIYSVPQDHPIVLVPGHLNTGAFTVTGQQQSYTFTAAAGQVFDFAPTTATPSCPDATVAGWELLDTSGKAIAIGDLCSDGAYPLTTSGPYTLVLIGKSGTYSFTVTLT